MMINVVTAKPNINTIVLHEMARILPNKKLTRSGLYPGIRLRIKIAIAILMGIVSPKRVSMFILVRFSRIGSDMAIRNEVMKLDIRGGMPIKIPMAMPSKAACEMALAKKAAFLVTAYAPTIAVELEMIMPAIMARIIKGSKRTVISIEFIDAYETDVKRYVLVLYWLDLWQLAVC